jgi:hypothetical protein
MDINRFAPILARAKAIIDRYTIIKMIDLIGDVWIKEGR